MPERLRRQGREIVMELKGVGRSFGPPGKYGLKVVENIDLRLYRGEIMALLGPSGAGKTTILRMLTGLLAPTSGEVLYHGRPLAGINPHASIVFQNYALFPWLTVLENVELGLMAKGTSAEERRTKSIKAVDLIGLDGFEEAYPRELSAGMQQRVGFARALVVEPQILCMDEPFSNLDVLSAENLKSELLDLWLEDKIPTQSIFLVTHNIQEAVALSDRIMILTKSPGRVRASIDVTLPHYRDDRSPEFLALMDRIYQIMTKPEVPVEEVGPAAAARRERRFQVLPHAKIGAIAGLVELVADRGGREDLHELGSELMLDIEDFLPIVEATQLLGLARIEAGDIELTAPGRRFATEGILERKEIFREQVLKTVQLIQQVHNSLRSKSSRAMPAEFFLNVLEKHFQREEAEEQLDTAIDWGRYAELFGYDEDANQLVLEEEAPAEEADPEE
jgi:NitT/TauT family transport system ATP-binding protein